MILYNSLGQTKQEFVPFSDKIVNMYTCGPTVYHYAHIGNLRTYIMEDVLEKYLRFSGYNVNRVMNITDVGHLSSDADTGEDKMLSGAKREHKTVLEIAKFYTDAFFEDCDKLNIKRPDVVEPATNCIDEFIDMITVLLEKGYAYIAGGNVYFDTSRLDTYYVFGNMNEDDPSVTRLTLYFGSQSQSSILRSLNGKAHGAWVIPAGTLSARASARSTTANTSISTAEVSTTRSPTTQTRSLRVRRISVTNGATTGSMCSISTTPAAR